MRTRRNLARAAAALVAGGLAAGSLAAADGSGEGVVGRITGPAGLFDFTKLDAQGEPLDDPDAVYTVTPWDCVRDETTGLTWEVKTTDDGLRDQSHTYTWHNPDPEENAGAPGRPDGGQCVGSACDTRAYVEAVNERGLCGHTDWRLPTRAELRTIVDYRESFPAIDRDFFPNTVTRSFWTAEPNSDHPGYAWHTDFKFGLASYYFTKAAPKPVRLVRGGSQQ